MLEVKPSGEHGHAAETAMKPLLVPIQRHLLGGCTINILPVKLPSSETYHLLCSFVFFGISS